MKNDVQIPAGAAGRLVRRPDEGNEVSLLFPLFREPLRRAREGKRDTKGPESERMVTG